jgi:hypothetical protein
MKSLLIFVICAATAFADLTTYKQPTSGDAQVKAQAIPTSTTIVTSDNADVYGLVIMNTTASAITVTVADRQTSPIALMSSVSVAANSTYVLSFPWGYPMQNGFTVIASGAGATFHAKWKQ